jgi:hypothetical protein
MRSELNEPGRGKLTSTTQMLRVAASSLQPSAVDAALGDDATPLTPAAGGRRDMAGAGGDAVRVSFDLAHASNSAAGAPSDDGLLKQLSRQLALLELHQRQIRRLLEQTEQYANQVAPRSAR